jgi:hypothetical protein
MVRVKNPQDFWAGILFIAFGGLALWLGRDYATGTLAKIGPGFLPVLLSIGLLGVGGILALRALAIEGPAIEKSQVVPQLFILAAIAVFAFGIERFGLALTVMAVAVTASFARRGAQHWLEVIALAVGLAVLCVLLFVELLGQPFMVWPL